MTETARREAIAKRLEVCTGTIARMEQIHPEMMKIILLGLEAEAAKGEIPQYRTETTQERFEELYDNLIGVINEEALIRLISIYTGHHKTTIATRLGNKFNMGLECNKQELIEAMEAIVERIEIQTKQ